MKEQLNELALFAGAGGGILGGKLLGWRTICAVEWDGYARDVLVARQNDGCLEAFPIWDDVCTFDGRPWRGIVDVVSGGFPCQDISCAGKGAGIEGDRSSMWKHMARIIGEVQPRYAFVENSPMLVGRGLAVVLSDLAAMGFDARWGIVGAYHAGAPHKRDRIWIVVTNSTLDAGEQWWAECAGLQRASWLADGGDDMADARGEGLQRIEITGALRDERNGPEAHGSVSECGSLPRSSIRHAAGAGLPNRINRSMGHADGERQLQPEGDESNVGRRAGDAGWWATEPNVGRVAHGVACRVDRLRCIGNGQVPAVAQLAWGKLKQ